MRHQADLEEDRDDDPDLNESDSVLPSLSSEESKISASTNETTQDPNDS